MQTQTMRLVPPGGLFDESRSVLPCSTEEELRRGFEFSAHNGRRVTLMGSARSFGQHFLPPPGELALDVSALGRGGKVVETTEDGSIWVRVGGGTRFCDLKELFPNHRVLYPPTSDRITVAGALAACTHNTNGYFPDEVRAFRLLTPGGDTFECSDKSEGLAGELFWATVGSFGALGATTELELLMHPIDPEQTFGVRSLYAGPSDDEKYLQVLRDARQDPRFSEGVGAVVYGNRGHAIVLGDEAIPLGTPRARHQALLTDDDIEAHAVSQGLANRFPRLAEKSISRTYPQGIVRWAPWYGFHFFHRGFDRAFEVLGRSGLKYALLRAAGVNPKLPVYHASWFYPAVDQERFVETYFQVLDHYPGIEKRVEQQDLVLLPPCKWPAHSLGKTEGPVGVFTASYSIAALEASERHRVDSFFREVTRTAHERVPSVRLSLCKQIHCDVPLLRSMHADWIDLVGGLKRRVDPQMLLTSGHLQTLLD